MAITPARWVPWEGVPRSPLFCLPYFPLKRRVPLNLYGEWRDRTSHVLYLLPAECGHCPYLSGAHGALTLSDLKVEGVSRSPRGGGGVLLTPPNPVAPLWVFLLPPGDQPPTPQSHGCLDRGGTTGSTVWLLLLLRAHLRKEGRFSILEAPLPNNHQVWKRAPDVFGKLAQGPAPASVPLGPNCRFSPPRQLSRRGLHETLSAVLSLTATTGTQSRA